MAGPIRVGLIGAGGIAGRHVQAYRALHAEGLVEVVAVCDAVAEAAARRARELSAPQTCSAPGDLLAAGVDAVDVCLPHDLHAPVALQALAAGAHVLTEKPIATTLADAHAMVEAARRAGLVLQVGHNERFDPQYQECARLVAAGEIGEVFCARADHNQDVRLPAGHWLRSRQRSGGGALIGSGIHRVDLLRWYLGEVAEVYSVQVGAPERLEGEAAALTTLRFRGGAVAEVSTNWAVRRFPWYEMLWLYGRQGSLHNVGGLHLQRGDGEAARIPLPDRDSFTEEIRHFLQCIREGGSPLTSGEDGTRTLAVCLAAYASAQRQRPVAVEV